LKQGGLIGKKVEKEEILIYEAGKKNKVLNFEKVKIKQKIPPNNERARKIFNTKERKLEIEKKLLINRLNNRISEFDQEVEKLQPLRMEYMEIVKILEMKQTSLYEDVIYLNEILNEDLENNTKLKKLTEEIDQFEEQLHKINNEILKFDEEIKYIQENNMDKLEKEYKALLEQESKSELHP